MFLCVRFLFTYCIYLVVMLLFVLGCYLSLAYFPNSDLSSLTRLCDVSCSLSLVENFPPVSPTYVMLHCSLFSLYTPFMFLFVLSILLLFI